MGENIKYEIGRFSLSAEEREAAKNRGNLAELEAEIARANDRIASGEGVDVVINGTPAIFHLLEERERFKEADRAHDTVSPISAHELGEEIAGELEDDEEMAA